MDKDKQIEEIANEIYETLMLEAECPLSGMDCSIIADLLVTKGYRKASEVVRCKDCKHAEIPLNGVFGDRGKRICVRLGRFYLPCEFYCQYGERRTEDEIH